MRFVLSLAFVCLACGACASSATHESRRVRFEIVQAFDATGDRIDIQQVWCDRTALVSGATLRVRGRYRLASVDRAQLYFGLTDGAGDMPPLVDVVRGENAFDLSMHVTRAGCPHVSLYAGPVVNNDNCIGKRRFDIVPE